MTTGERISEIYRNYQESGDDSTVWLRSMGLTDSDLAEIIHLITPAVEEMLGLKGSLSYDELTTYAAIWLSGCRVGYQLGGVDATTVDP